MARILVADDQAIYRTALARCLQNAGHDVAEAADGAEALRLVRSACPPDLVLLDLAMPHRDGVAFLQELASDPAAAAVRVIVVTAVSDASARDRVLRLGAHDYLVKSRFPLSELVDRVGSCLSTR